MYCINVQFSLQSFPIFSSSSNPETRNTISWSRSRPRSFFVFYCCFLASKHKRLHKVFGNRGFNEFTRRARSVWKVRKTDVQPVNNVATVSVHCVDLIFNRRTIFNVKRYTSSAIAAVFYVFASSLQPHVTAGCELTRRESQFVYWFNLIFDFWGQVLRKCTVSVRQSLCCSYTAPDDITLVRFYFYTRLCNCIIIYRRDKKHNTRYFFIFFLYNKFVKKVA